MARDFKTKTGIFSTQLLNDEREFTTVIKFEMTMLRRLSRPILLNVNYEVQSVLELDL